jgi:drug/metabolite transporter (DMT)-like permease
MQIRSKAYLQMHIATFLWGVTAILGRLISVTEFTLVWYRMLLVSLTLLFMPSLFNALKRIPAKSLLYLVGIGILLSLHWVAWYGAIKYSNASVAVSCIAAVSLFVAILEPFLLGIPFNRSNVILGIMIIPGILLINQSINLTYKFGFLLGILSAVFAAVFTILNKKYTETIAPGVITFIQMVGGWVFLSLCLPVYIHYNPDSFHWPNLKDLILLLVLSIFCTAIPYNLFLRALKESNAFTTSLINNLEPIYGILLAAIILKENKELTINFYFGTGIILLAVFLHAFYNYKSSSRI